MEHRHLNCEDWTVPAADNAIVNGTLRDWIALREAIAKDRALFERVAHLCSTSHGDEGEQRYTFWRKYVQSQRAA